MKKLMKFSVLLLAVCGLALSANAQDVISTVIGGGPNNIPGVNANLSGPYQVAVDSSGNVYVAAAGQNRVFKISTSGVITIVAGNGLNGYSGDGGPATQAMLYTPQGVAVDTANPANVYIADYNNCLVRKVSQSTGNISTVAGVVNHPTTGNPYVSCGFTNGVAANTALLDGPTGVSINTSTGDLYIADYSSGSIRKVAGASATGTLSLVAGSGGTTNNVNCQGSEPYGDGSAATSAYLCNPAAVSVDSSVSPANVFITDYSRCVIREVVGSSGKIYQLAGSYTAGCGFTDNVSAPTAQLQEPYQTHVSVSGSTTTVQIADYGNARVRQFTLTYSSGVPKPGTITTIGGKGQGGFCNDTGPVLNACMNPVGIAYDSSGNYYIGDYGSDRVRKITKSSTDINTIAGWGPNGGTQANFSNPVGITASGGEVSLYQPYSVYADPTSSKVYVGGYQGQAIYVWDSSSNEVSDVAGSGVNGFAGDGGPANTDVVDLSNPFGVAKDSHGNVYIADQSNCAIREVNASSGDITTVVGGSSGALKGCGYSGDGGPAVNAQLSYPQDVVFDSANNMYITDYYNCAIRKVNASTNNISTIIGGPTLCGFAGDGGLASAAELRNPVGLALDGSGNIYFTDPANYRVREISALTGYINTVAGDGTPGYSGDGLAVGNALNSPQAVAADANGNFFIADTYNQIVRWVTPTGAMITIGGTVPGSAIASNGFSGDGGNALKAQMYQPTGITVDKGGNYYVADEDNGRVRKISAFAGFGLSTANITFNTQPDGTTSDFQPLTISAVGSITFSSITVPSPFTEVDDCGGETLTAGQTCEVDVYFAPTSPGNFNGTLHVNANQHFASNPTNVALSGSGGGLKFSASENFFTVPVGSKPMKTVTLENLGPAVSITSISLTSTKFFSVLSSSTCPISGGTLAANKTCTIVTQFAPTSASGYKSTLVVASKDPASPLLAQAIGYGTEVTVSTTAINFGTITHGTNKTVNLTVSNTGTVSYTLSPAITGSDFTISSTGKTCGSSVAAGASCVLPVEYAPTSAGSNSGSLKLTTNGGSNPVITLTGVAN